MSGHHAAKFEEFQDTVSDFRWHLKGGNGEIVAQGESHGDRSDAKRAYGNVARIAGSATPMFLAELCHEVNRAYCESLGDKSQPTWDDAPQWQRDSAVNGALAHLRSEMSPEQSHESWMAEKRRDGWIYGAAKDPEKKTHPCMMKYDQLPAEQRAKDYLFRAIVNTFKPKD